MLKIEILVKNKNIKRRYIWHIVGADNLGMLHHYSIHLPQIHNPNLTWKGRARICTFFPKLQQLGQNWEPFSMPAEVILGQSAENEKGQTHRDTARQTFRQTEK